jgi:hypothetical protein
MEREREREREFCYPICTINHIFCRNKNKTIYTTARAEVKKGQTTAIITGAIAVILGVAYLVLVQLLDSRGTNLVPPPPEAFGL